MRRSNGESNILIVDDTPENLTVLRQMLTEQGYRIRPALSGEIALKAIQTAPPDLILLDIMMPGMDGYEVSRKLKSDRRLQDIPILFISALDDITDKVKAFQAGGVDYITKPFQLEEVLARVETHLTLRTIQKRLQEQNIRLQKANYQLRERQNTIVNLLGDISRIKFSGDRHAMRNLAHKVLENQKNQFIENIARQIYISYQLVRSHEKRRSYLLEACQLFGITDHMLSDPTHIEKALQNVEIEKAGTAPEPSDAFSNIPRDDMDQVFLDIFADTIYLDKAYQEFQDVKSRYMKTASPLSESFDPFVLFYSLKRMQDFIGEMNKRFSRYDKIGFLEQIKLSEALESACEQAVEEKSCPLKVIKEIDYDPGFNTHRESLIYVLRDLFYNAIDAASKKVKVVSIRPSDKHQLPFIDRWAFEDYPSLYLLFEDDGKGISEQRAQKLNAYLVGEFDDESALTTKGKEKGGLGTKTLRDFFCLHKGYGCYESSPSGTRVHIYLEKLEI